MADQTIRGKCQNLFGTGRATDAYTHRTGARKGFVCQKSVALLGRLEQVDWRSPIPPIQI
jgi:hypothetical protein